jgi:orotidine-5'-phosphate decarboxylase
VYLDALNHIKPRLFLDLKLHDIPETVARLTRQVTRLGVDFLTVHAGGGSRMLKAAVEAAGTAPAHRPLRILAVTVLTSFSEDELQREWNMKEGEAIRDRVLTWAALARDAGCHGIVCSPLELSVVRKAIGDSMLTFVPGIRAPGDPPGDQHRTMSPREAVEAGADYLVVGRPIVAAPDPRAAAETIAREIEAVPA